MSLMSVPFASSLSLNAFKIPFKKFIHANFYLLTPPTSNPMPKDSGKMALRMQKCSEKKKNSLARHVYECAKRNLREIRKISKCRN